MSHRKAIIERAYELARSGTMLDILHIKMKLNAEGYDNVDAHLDGALIRKELRQILEAAPDRVDRTEGPRGRPT